MKRIVFGALAIGLLVMLAGAAIRPPVQSRLAGTARAERIRNIIVLANPAATLRDFGGDFPDFFAREAEAHGFTWELAAAWVGGESGWDPRAVSPKGAVGLTQVMPVTALVIARGIGDHAYVAPTVVRGRYATLGTLGDARRSLVYGLTYLRWRVDLYGVVPGLRAYNRGDAARTSPWPRDRYAEDIGLRFLALTHRGGEGRGQ